MNTEKLFKLLKKALIGNNEKLIEELVKVINDRLYVDNLLHDPITILGREHKTTQVGSQLWSEDLFIPEIGIKVADKKTRFTWYHLPAIKAVLPEGWRLPTKQDFDALVNLFNNNCKNFARAWALLPENYNLKSLALNPFYADYWSSTQYSTGRAYYLSLYTSGAVYPQNYNSKVYGFRVRCVRDI
jgi:hypothetical protein